MNITLKYFGMIASITERDREIMDIASDMNIEELNTVLVQKYSKLSNLTYQLARNNTIANMQEIIFLDDEIALLPPFAGG